jgi:hypothetical protein
LTYGILLGGLGLGALAAAVLLPAFKGAASVEGLILFGTVAFALASFALAMLRDAALLFVVLVIGGVGWLVLLSTLNAGTRLHVPRWVEARPRRVPRFLSRQFGCGKHILGSNSRRRGDSPIAPLRMRPTLGRSRGATDLSAEQRRDTGPQTGQLVAASWGRVGACQESRGCPCRRRIFGADHQRWPVRPSNAALAHFTAAGRNISVGAL